jgi:tRNA pseudouridine38-40 synthase
VPSFKLTIAYDGTGLVGWQRQAAGLSVQGFLEDALAQLDGRHVTVIGAGRTDAGVHALGQVASLSLAREIDGASLMRALNAKLPPAIRVVDALDVPASFHARFDARSKTYRYRMWNGEVVPPFERHYVWHVPGGLDVGAMSDAAAIFEGEHDFAAFQSVGTEQATTTRRVRASHVYLARGSGAAAELPEAAGELVVFEVAGDGFLRHMVRSMAGTLVEVGRGRRPSGWVAEVLAARERSRAGPRAPAEGLFLVRVEYA